MMWIRCATLLLALSLASRASAQQTRDSVGSGRSALDVAFISGARTNYRETSNPFSVVQFRLVQHIAMLAPSLALEFELDASLFADAYISSIRVDGGLTLGSPWLGLGIAHRSDSQTLRASVGVAPPLATVRGTPLMPGGSAGMGRWNEWLAEISLVPMGLNLMGAWRFTEVEVGVDAALIVSPGFTYASRRGDEPTFAAWGALGVWLTGHLSESFDLGARVQWVTGFTQRDPLVIESHETILSGVLLTPFVRYVFAQERAALDPSYVELRTHFNVIAPDGPFLIANEFTWSLGVAAGTNW